VNPRTLGLDPRIHAFLLEEGGLEEHPALAELRRASEALSGAGMLSSPEQMRLIGLLLRLVKARRVLEVGCWTGYGALAMALALPEGGEVVTIDHDPEPAGRIGRPHWRRAGVEERIRLVVDDGLAAVRGLLGREGEGAFDLAYLDADKERYPDYLDPLVRLVRPGGLLVADNVLWSGGVADPEAHDPLTDAIRTFLRRARRDPRLDAFVLPVGDGLLIGRRIG